MIGAKNDVAGYRNLNNDGVVLTPSIGQMLLFKGSAASCCALAISSRDPALAIAHPTSASCKIPLWSGGADRDRTGDLLLAKQALSQLSYSP
jgi:hypothetical protein